MKLNEEESKALALQILFYRLEHPEIIFKEMLPDYLYKKIRRLKNHCPMCQLFYVKDGGVMCPDCPLRKGQNNQIWTCNDFSKEAIQNNISLLVNWKPVMN